MTHGKTYNKSPRRINHKATKSKTNTGAIALERSVEQTTGRFKALLQLTNFTLGPDATLNTEIHKNSVRIKAPNLVNASKWNHKNQINHYNKQRRVLMANSTVCQSKWKPIVEPKLEFIKHWLVKMTLSKSFVEVLKLLPEHEWDRYFVFRAFLPCLLIRYFVFYPSVSKYRSSVYIPTIFFYN